MNKMEFNPLTGEIDLVGNPSEIQFFIDGEQYTAPIGISWLEWIYRYGPKDKKGYYRYLVQGNHIFERKAEYDALQKNECYSDISDTDLLTHKVFSQDLIIPGYNYFSPQHQDMGIPDIKWATFNIGAVSLSEVGGLYASGEFFEKSEYTERNFSGISIIKPNNVFSDIVSARWGKADDLGVNNWRTPSVDDFMNLFGNSTLLVNDGGIIIHSNSTGANIILPLLTNANGNMEGAYETYDPVTLSRMAFVIKVINGEIYLTPDPTYPLYLPKLVRAVYQQ